MPRSALKSAVIGLGVGEQHALALLRDPRCELAYVSDLDEVRAQNFIQAQGGQKIELRSFPKIVSDESTQLVSIASYDEDHFAQVSELLKTGKHVFVEKPLCQTRAELEDLFQLWTRHPKALGSNLVLRKAPLYLKLKEMIDTGDLGEIYAFDGDYLYGRLHKITEGWRAKTDNYSVMEGGGIHIIDLMLWLTGQKPSRVSTLGNKIASRETDFQYNDYMCSQFEFESGLIGRITANFGCVHRHHHVIRIFGTKGTFIYDDQGPRIHWSREEDSAAESLNDNPLPEHKGVLLPEFIDKLLENDIKDAAYREFNLMSVVLSASEALGADAPIHIEYVTC